MSLTPVKAHKHILACDVGGTQIKIGIVRGKTLLARCEIEARQNEGLATALVRIAATSKKLCRTAKSRPQHFTGFAMTFPGIIQPGSGKILSSPKGKFDDAKTLDVPAIVQRLLGLPSLICNDANAALAAEWRYGAARGCRSAVIMTLGTGIGTSAIIDGIPLRGQHGQAGTLGGHFLASVSGRLCNCGNVGCVETEASTWALPGLIQSDPNISSSALARAPKIDYAAVFREAAKGDRLALDFRQRALDVWSGALISLIHAYDPERAIIGGGIMRSAHIILPALKGYVAKHAWTAWGKVSVRPAQLGNNAGMLGAAWLLENEPT
jgi:glucokinase